MRKPNSSVWRKRSSKPSRTGSARRLNSSVWRKRSGRRTNAASRKNWRRHDSSGARPPCPSGPTWSARFFWMTCIREKAASRSLKCPPESISCGFPGWATLPTIRRFPSGPMKPRRFTPTLLSREQQPQQKLLCALKPTSRVPFTSTTATEERPGAKSSSGPETTSSWWDVRATSPTQLA